MEGKEAVRRLSAVTSGALLAATAALLLAAPANAGLLVTTASDCPDQAVENPFTRWGDSKDYVAVPGGSFESGDAAWSTRGDADVVDGNEPFDVRSADDANSLSLPPGSSATSASICVGIEHPTMRFIARSKGSTLQQLLSAMTVEVLFQDAGGATRSLPIGILKSPFGWGPTPSYRIIANLLPLLSGDKTAIAFRFTPIGGAGWQIDDVYVDPKSRI
jgi:hypothetical protein